jgi:hypothetical protein
VTGAEPLHVVGVGAGVWSRHAESEQVLSGML